MRALRDTSAHTYFVTQPHPPPRRQERCGLVGQPLHTAAHNAAPRPVLEHRPHPTPCIFRGLRPKPLTKTRHFRAHFCWISEGREATEGEGESSFQQTQQIMLFTWHHTVVVIITHPHYKSFVLCQACENGSSYFERLCWPLLSKAPLLQACSWRTTIDSQGSWT